MSEKHLMNEYGDCVEWCPLCAEIKLDMDKGILPKFCPECSANFPVRLDKCPECSDLPRGIRIEDE